jgi:glycosyltransferase involved in cell wall biosynthesis
MLHRGDAVGRHTLHIRDVLAGRGIASRIYVETMDLETVSDTGHFTRYAEHAEPGDVLLYQFATASALAPWLVARRERLVLSYHNITPPEHYAPWDNGLARHQLAAQVQLRDLAPRCTLAIAVSHYNEAELVAAGYQRTAVVAPAAMLPVGSAAPPHRAPRQRGACWLSVGRLAPNKALEHAVMALLVARAHHDPDASLQLVGRPVVDSYATALQRFSAELGLDDAVTFRGQLGDEGLQRALSEADVLVLPSAHEGFGIPVVEAMALGLPVVANRAGALPGIVGDGGLLVDAADPYALAGAVAQVVNDAPTSERLADGAARQLAALDLPGAGARLADLVGALL